MEKQNSTDAINHASIPSLRFPEFEGEWEKKKLGEVVKINQGLQIAISERLTEQVEGSYFYITNEFLKKNSEKKYFIKNPSRSVLCNKEDILMTRTGNTGMVVTNVEGAFHNNFFKVAYPKYISKIFLYNFLKLEKTQNAILKMAGTSTIPDLNHSDFYRITLHFPSLIEQTKIANFLTAVDEKIQFLKKKKKGLEEYKKGVMQGLFSNRRDAINRVSTDADVVSGANMGADMGAVSGADRDAQLGVCTDVDMGAGADMGTGRDAINRVFTDADGKPYPDWEVKKLGEVCVIKKGEQLNKEELTEIGNYPCLNGGINYSGFTDKFNSDENTITISEGGNSCGYINFMNTKFWLGGHCYKIVLNTETNLMYFYQLLKYNQEKIMQLRVGSGLPNIQQKDLRNFEFLICNSLPEQTKIANFLSAIDEKINHTTIQIYNTEQWKKGLLQKMFV